MNIGGQHTNMSGQDYDVIISDSWQSSTTSTSFNLNLDVSGFKINWRGDDEPYHALKGSTATVTFLVKNGTDESTLLTPFTSPNTTYYMQIFNSESNVWWYGYVVSKVSSVKNESYPKEVKIEAVDRIVLSKERGLWDTSKTIWGGHQFQYEYKSVNHGPLELARWRTGKSTGTALFSGEDVTFRFGEAYSGIGGNLPHNPNPFVPEALHSLLFDIDRDSDGVLWCVEHYDFQQSNTQRLDGGFGHTMLDVDVYLYADYPDNKEARSVTVYEMLQHICEVFNARLFQYNGEYYFVQNEVYQRGNTVNYYTFDRGIATGPQPVNNTNGTLSTSDYRLTLSSGAAPTWVEGSAYETREALARCELATLAGSLGSTLSEKTMAHSTNKTISNLTRFSQPYESIPLTGGIRFPFGSIVVHSNAGPMGTSWIPIVNREDGSGTTQSYDFHSHCLVARFEASSDVNDVMVGSIYDTTEYNPTKSIVYGSTVYHWTQLDYSSEENIWSGRWIQMNAKASNNEGYSEIITEDG